MHRNSWDIQLTPPGPNCISCMSDWSWDTRTGLGEHAFLTVLQGKGTWYCEDDKSKIPARVGSCMLLRKGYRYRAEMNPDDPMVLIFVHFDFIARDGTLLEVDPARLGKQHHAFPTNHFVFSLLEKALHAAQYQRNLHAAAAWFKVVLLEYLQEQHVANSSDAENHRAEQIEQACHEIRQKPGRAWRVADLANRFDCTPDHFSRAFRKSVGCSPGEFIIQARIDAAMPLLRSSAYSVTRISELLGYGDVFAFSRQFRQKTGVTPTRYRKRKRRRKNKPTAVS